MNFNFEISRNDCNAISPICFCISTLISRLVLFCRCNGKVIFILSDYFYASEVCQFAVNFAHQVDAGKPNIYLLIFIFYFIYSLLFFFVFFKAIRFSTKVTLTRVFAFHFIEGLFLKERICSQWCACVC